MKRRLPNWLQRVACRGLVHFNSKCSPWLTAPYTWRHWIDGTLRLNATVVELSQTWTPSMSWKPTRHWRIVELPHLMMSTSALRFTKYRVGQKVTRFWYFEFPPLLDALYLQFLFTDVSFSLSDGSSSSANANKLFFYANKLYFRHRGWINWRWTLFDSQSPRGETLGFRKNLENVFK